MKLLVLLIILVLRDTHRVTNGRRIIVNSGRIVVDPITCFGNSHMLSAAYGLVAECFPVVTANYRGA